MYIFLVAQVSLLVKNFNVGIYSYAKNVINLKLRIMVLLIELYMYIILAVTMTIFQGHSNVRHLCFYPVKWKLSRIVK